MALIDLDRVMHDLETADELDYAGDTVTSEAFSHINSARQQEPFVFRHCTAKDEIDLANVGPDENIIVPKGHRFTFIDGKSSPILPSPEVLQIVQGFVDGETLVLRNVCLDVPFRTALYSTDPQQVSSSLLLDNVSFGDPAIAQIHLASCVFRGQIHLRNTECSIIRVASARFTDHMSIEGCTANEHLYVRWSQFEDHAPVRLENLQLADLTVWESVFDSKVQIGAQIRGDLSVKHTLFRSGVDFGESILAGRRNELVDCNISGWFQLRNDYWKNGSWIRQLGGRLFSSTVPRLIVSQSSAADCTNLLFSRWVQDENYLEQFAEKAPRIAWLWGWTCDYGRSFSLWLTWSIFLALVFALIFSVPHLHFYVAPDSAETSVPFLQALYFSVVTFTTLGFGDVTPVSGWGRFWVAAEVIVGYLMLGGLISILADKLARRS